MRGAGCISGCIVIRPIKAVAVPVRGAGCIQYELNKAAEVDVAVPVRGAGCIDVSIRHSARTLVAVPVRGAGCIGKRIQTRISIFVGSSQPVSAVYHTSVQKGKLFCAYQTETTDLFDIRFREPHVSEVENAPEKHRLANFRSLP